MMIAFWAVMPVYVPTPERGNEKKAARFQAGSFFVLAPMIRRGLAA